jgi:hypothetical protein
MRKAEGPFSRDVKRLCQAYGKLPGFASFPASVLANVACMYENGNDITDFNSEFTTLIDDVASEMDLDFLETFFERLVRRAPSPSWLQARAALEQETVVPTLSS